MEQGWGLLEESRHLGVFVHRALDRQETPVQLVNQTHVYDIAEKETRKVEKQAVFSCYMTSCNSLRDTSVKRSSNSHKQRRLLCILSQHCGWKQIPHLSPPPPITVISPICLGQWQVSWSCSLYSFSYKSLLIVSLQGCCASPALGLWQCADLGLSSHHSSLPGPGGRLSNRELKKTTTKKPKTHNTELRLPITDFS